jgi:hypothetical protein
MSAKPAHSSDDGENSVRERTSGARAGGRPRLGAAQVLTVDVEAVREAPPVGGAHELEALGEDPEPALHLLRALVALAVPASRGQTATGGERQEGSRRSPDGKAGEAEGVAGAADRRDDGGLERGDRAVGDRADRVGVGEGGGRGGHSGGGGEGNHGESHEEEAAALGHVAVTGFLRGEREERDEMSSGGRGVPGLVYRAWCILLD